MAYHTFSIGDNSGEMSVMVRYRHIQALNTTPMYVRALPYWITKTENLGMRPQLTTESLEFNVGLHVNFQEEPVDLHCFPTWIQLSSSRHKWASSANTTNWRLTVHVHLAPQISILMTEMLLKKVVMVAHARLVPHRETIGK
ncbi:hypothetical protein TNCT_650321 [Trichonephila clavata]|uniref:Uncharacterized protein n=1 Tax=Trichonephila clavata TaxID=2740835 RepID=A0A8X6H151_TRICU|nr:hypothetical protein TNCT_650321 [Trichonephila clavata]